MKIKKTNEKEQDSTFEIDLIQLVKACWKKAWLIVLVCILAGVLAFGYTTIFVQPMYSSSVLLYVNNSSISVGGISISASELAAAQSLVDTYMVILKNRTTMNLIIDKTGINDSYQSLLGMISAAPIEETEIFRVTVTTTDPYKATLIANSIADVLPGRIEEIIDGSSMRVVDSAVVNPTKVSPNVTRNTAIGIFMGFVLSCLAIAVITILDDTIRNEDYILQNYDIPILSKIPDLSEDNTKNKYAYKTVYKLLNKK